ncbi:MAG: hypothetical protein J0L97_10645 [Alphaproteobacteria bacterium]|nr:hypothetical protein [Alphaproteobacteria bacterium]
MKEVEHRHADQREHYGQSGLNMMAASGDGAYLFRSDDIEKGRKLLLSQIPKLLSQPSFGDGVSFNDFMHLTYNETPLISSVIKDVLVGHEEIEIATPTGGSRSSPIPSVRR